MRQQKPAPLTEAELRRELARANAAIEHAKARKARVVRELAKVRGERVPRLVPVALLRSKNGEDEPLDAKEIARLEHDDEVKHVGAGSIIYVEAGRDHRFIDIVEDVEALVIFAPAEGSTVARAAR